MRFINCSPKESFEEFDKNQGEFILPKHIKEIVRENTTAYDETGKVLFIFIKNYLNNISVNNAEVVVKACATFTKDNNNRGAAAGNCYEWRGKEVLHISKYKYLAHPILEDGTVSPRQVSNGVPSQTGGWMDTPNRNLITMGLKNVPRCRLTMFSRYRPEQIKLVPLMEELSEAMKKYCPHQWAAQNEHLKECEDKRLGNSVFTTFTCNASFRTAIHLDSGDFEKGIGVLSSFGKFEGCEFCLPRYEIGIDLQPSDLLLVNVREYHGNLPLTTGERYSLVSYSRQFINRCHNEIIEPTNNKIVSSLWIGEIGPIEYLSIKSFIENGYTFCLYTYKSVGQVPNGTILLDANKVIPYEVLEQYEGTISSFADMWRYKLLSEGGCWVDLDMVCLRPLPEDPYLYSSEHTIQKGGRKSRLHYVPNIGILRAPSNNHIFPNLYRKVKDTKPTENISHMRTYRRYLDFYNQSNKVALPDDYCPVPWANAKEIFTEPLGDFKSKYGMKIKPVEWILENSYCIHLWRNLALKKYNITEYKEGSLFDYLCKKFKCDFCKNIQTSLSHTSSSLQALS